MLSGWREWGLRISTMIKSHSQAWCQTSVFCGYGMDGWRGHLPGISPPVRVYILSVALNKALETASFATQWGTHHGLDKETNQQSSCVISAKDPIREGLKNKRQLALSNK